LAPCQQDASDEGPYPNPWPEEGGQYSAQSGEISPHELGGCLRRRRTPAPLAPAAGPAARRGPGGAIAETKKSIYPERKAAGRRRARATLLIDRRRLDLGARRWLPARGGDVHI